MTSRSIFVADPRQAHAAISDLYRLEIKPHTANGAAGIVTWQTADARLRHQLRKLFHGPVLRDIALQVWLRDPETGRRVRYAPLAWKELLRQLFIAPSFEEVPDAQGVMRLQERRRSFEALSDDEFASVLLQVQAFAVNDLNVTFTEQDDQP